MLIYNMIMKFYSVFCDDAVKFKKLNDFLNLVRISYEKFFLREGKY